MILFGVMVLCANFTEFDGRMIVEENNTVSGEVDIVSGKATTGDFILSYGCCLSILCFHTIFNHIFLDLA